MQSDNQTTSGLPTGNSSIWRDAIRQKDFGAIADWFTDQFFRTGIGALFAVGLAAGLSADSASRGFTLGFRIFALGLLVAGACTVSGWLLGLLFGIPRTLARASAGPVPPASGAPAGQAQQQTPPSSRVNTNLEDISDWLTKTIIGVGLTQLYNVPPFLWKLAHDANALGFDWNPYGHLLALGLMFYFAPGGFWLGYVGTRTILTKLFDWADGPSQEDLVQAARLTVHDGAITAATAQQQPVDAALLATPLKQLTTTAQIMAWAAAQARAHNFDDAKVALNSILVDDPGNREARDQLYTIQNVEMVYALYEPGPQGFTRAIQIGEALLDDARSADDANLHVWLACAYSQKYGDAKARHADDATLAQIKTRVLKEIDDAIRLDKNSRQRLHAYWQPDPGSIDNDLSWFTADDPDLAKRLNPPATDD
jgi:hypothetical protein